MSWVCRQLCCECALGVPCYSATVKHLAVAQAARKSSQSVFLGGPAAPHPPLATLQ